MTKQNEEKLVMLFDVMLAVVAAQLNQAAQAEGTIADYWQHRANGVAGAFLRDLKR